MDENNDTLGERHGTHRGGDAAASELQSAPAQHAVMHAVDPARLESQSRTSTAGTLQKTQFLNCHVQKEAISN